jgi:hypothetical protein
MKKIWIIGGALVATVLGGHFVLWKHHATLVDNALEQIVSSVNSELKTQALTLRFDGKQSQAVYPFKAYVTYKNPVITFTSAFYKHPAIATFYEQSQGELPFFDSIAVQGDYAIESDKLGKTFSTKITGEAKTAGHYLDGVTQEVIAYSLKSDAVMQCNVMLARSPIRSLLGAKPAEGTNAFEQLTTMIDSLGCATDKAMLTDSIAAKPIAGWDDYTTSFAFKDSTTPKHKIVDADIAIKALEYFTTQETLLRDYERSFAPLTDAQRSVFALLRKHPVPLLSQADAGKQDIHFAGTYDGAVTEKALSREDAAFDVQVNRLEVKNNLYHTNTPFSLRMNKEAMTVTLDGEARYNTGFETMLHASVDAIMQIIHSPELQVEAELNAMLKSVTSDQLHALVPRLNELGDIALKADMHIPSEKDAAITVKNTGFSSTKYGLLLSGNGTLDPLTGAAELRCTTCDTLLHDMLNYAQKLQAVSKQVNLALVPDAAQTTQLTPEFADAIVAFIFSFDTKTDKDATIITLNATPEAGITISGSPMMMVLFKGMTTFSPYLQQ